MFAFHTRNKFVSPEEQPDPNDLIAARTAFLGIHGDGARVDLQDVHLRSDLALQNEVPENETGPLSLIVQMLAACLTSVGSRGRFQSTQLDSRRRWGRVTCPKL